MQTCDIRHNTSSKQQHDAELAAQKEQREAKRQQREAELQAQNSSVTIK